MLFLQLLERNIIVGHLNNLLSVAEISRLQFTCKSIQKIVLHWKENFECLETFEWDHQSSKDNQLLKLVRSAHKNIKKVCIPSTVSNLAYHYLTLLKNVKELDAINVSPNGLKMITSTMLSLTHLTLSRNTHLTPSHYFDEFDSITQLSNLNSLTMIEMHYFNDEKGINFHKLKFLQSFNIFDIPYLFETQDNFIPKLTSLTKLTISNCRLDDENLSKICLGCQLIEDLDVGHNFLLTLNGLSNIQRLNKINSLHFTIWSMEAFGHPPKRRSFDKWTFEKLGQEKFHYGSKLFWETFTKISTLQFLDLGWSTIDQEDINQIEASQLKLANFRTSEFRWTLVEPGLFVLTEA
jgi:hypothetical protein